MGNLFAVSGIILLANVLLCWLLTSGWMLNPVIVFVVFMSGIFVISYWGMSVLENTEE